MFGRVTKLESRVSELERVLEKRSFSKCFLDRPRPETRLDDLSSFIGDVRNDLRLLMKYLKLDFHNHPEKKEVRKCQKATK